MSILLHEQLLLIALDDEKGTIGRPYVDIALAGAVLVDLLRGGRIATVDSEVRAVPHAATVGGVLDDAAAVIAGEPRVHDLRWWVKGLRGRLKPFVPRLAARLVQDGVLAAEQHKVLGLFPSTRLPERDHASEAEVDERLRQTLLGESPPDEDSAVLAGLVGAANLVGSVVEDRTRRKEAERRAEELGRGLGVGTAVEEAIAAARAEVMAAVIASTVSSATSATIVAP